MPKKIVATDPGPKRIRDTSPGEPRIDPAFVAEALGAEATDIAPGGVGARCSRFR